MAGWFALLTALAAATAYYWIFSGFEWFDDEGAVMTGVHQMLHGVRPYQDAFAIYGPVHFLYAGALRLLTGTPVTHDVVRLSSLLPWLATSLLAAWLVWRKSRSWLLSTAAHFFTFRLLSFFKDEPGHPQELGVMLLMAAFAAAFLVDSSLRRWRWLLLGALAAALALVKSNIGIFVLLGTALPILASLPRTWLRQAAFWTVGLAAVALPAILMRVHFDDPHTVSLASAVAGGMTACIVVLRDPGGRPPLPWQAAWTALAGFLAVLAAILGGLLALGIHFSNIVYSLVLRSLHVNVYGRAYYTPLALSARLWIPWAAVCLLLAVAAVRLPPGRRTAAIAVLQFGFAPAAIVFCLWRPWSAAGFAAGLSWLVMFPGRAGAPRLGRAILCATAILHLLLAYPIAGSQVPNAYVPFLVIALICLSDSLLVLRERSKNLWLWRWERVAVPAAALLMLTLYIQLLAARRAFYESLPALGMTGAEHVHAGPQTVADYRWLAGRIRANCDMFVGYPGLPSLHLFTGVPYPGTLNLADWMLSLDDGEQEALARDLDRHPDACVVYNPGNVKRWLRAGQPGSAYPGANEVFPLARYIAANFKAVDEYDGYTLMFRRERAGPLGSGRIAK